MSLKTFNTTFGPGLNESSLWSVPQFDLDVFYNPDVVIIVLYVVVLTASLSANTLLIFVVIKFQYMRSWQCGNRDPVAPEAVRSCEAAEKRIKMAAFPPNEDEKFIE
ncbi:unnamed protein product [Arctia plantaginis]|uniref:Uncharacterized protein n=1 Tax=Arctia plantaginis TaxID=874455 RepID=A0A8S1A6W6_ARCPL|nr:unnamed protein product [Arctia plantaginis]